MARTAQVLIALLLTVVVAPTSISAAGAASGNQAQTPLPAGVTFQDGFYWYTNAPMPKNAHVETIQGAKNDHGCVFKGELRLEPGQADEMSVERAYDPIACRQVVATGQSSGPPGAYVSGRRPTIRGRSFLLPRLRPLASGSNTAHLWSAWKDPLNINTSEVRSIINWSYNGSCVTSGSGDFKTGYYGASGWQPPTGVQKFPTLNCSYFEEDGTAHFKNPYWPPCGGYTVYADYWYNRADGQPDGSLVGYWYTQVSGGANGCTNSLYQVHDLAYGP